LKLNGGAANADKMAPSNYPYELADLIEKGGYCFRQVFSIDETSHFWGWGKCCQTYLAEDEGNASRYKQAKDRLTLLLRGNAEGYFKLKPLLTLS
jgi:hypothetical protein